MDARVFLRNKENHQNVPTCMPKVGPGDRPKTRGLEPNVVARISKGNETKSGQLSAICMLLDHVIRGKHLDPPLPWFANWPFQWGSWNCQGDSGLFRRALSFDSTPERVFMIRTIY